MPLSKSSFSRRFQVVNINPPPTEAATPVEQPPIESIKDKK